MSFRRRWIMCLGVLFVLAAVIPPKATAAAPPVVPIEVGHEHAGDDIESAKAKPAKYGLDKISVTPKRFYAGQRVRFGSRLKGGPATVWYVVTDRYGDPLYASLPCWCGNGAIWIYDVFPNPRHLLDLVRC